MAKIRKQDREQISYLPDEGLVGYMQKKYQFEIRRIRTGLGGTDLQKDKIYQALKRRKRDMLEKVFKSMANLLFFLESLENIPSSINMKEYEREAHKRLQKDFEDEVKELFGVSVIRTEKDKQTKKDKQIYGFTGFIFDRLIFPLIYTGDGNVDRDDYFRLKLIHILQESVFLHIQAPLTPDFSLDGKGIVLTDISRAKTWTEMLARRADEDDNLEPPSITFNFKRDLYSERASQG